jgi:hypothetical protein
MKKPGALTAVAIATSLVMPAAAHHAAEGVVADDIYEAISENLAGTPHEDLDFDAVSDDMGEALVAVVTVTLPAAQVDDMLVIIDDTVGDVLAAQGRVLADDAGSNERPVSVETSAPDEDDQVTITITEHLGVGESQDDVVDEYGNRMF